MMAFRYIWVALAICLFSGTCLAQDVDETELNRLADQVANLQAQITQQNTQLQQANSALTSARDDAYNAERRLAAAQRESRTALDRSISAISASEYLSGTQAALQELRARLADATGDERAVLEAQVTALQRQLSEESRRYGGQSNQRLAEIDRTSRAVSEAEAVLVAARAQIATLQSTRTDATARIEALHVQLGRALEAMAAESDQVAPAWVQDVRVTQGGTLIYHASWAPDASVSEGIRVLIDEQVRQRAELARIRALVVADIETYGRESNAAYREIIALIDEQLYNDVAVIVGDKLWNFGQITLLFTTGAGVASAGYSAAAATGSLTSRAALSAASRAATASAATEVSFLGLPNFLRWPAFATRATTALRITSQAWSYEQALARSWRFTEATAATLTAIQTVDSGVRLASGTYFSDSLRERHDDADFRRARGVLQRAVQRVENFPEEQRGFIMRMSMRQKYAEQSANLMNQAYTQIQNQVLEVESDFWHTIYIGYIWTSRAEIAGALDQAALMYMRALQSGYGNLIDIAMEEIDDIDAAIADIDARLAELRAELAGPDVRKLTVHANNRLRVRDDGTAQISITFSQPLAEAPRVKIGAGPAVAFEINPQPGDGLPLPDIAGAVNADITGQGATWSGPFPLRPLREFVDSDAPLPIEISGRDSAGRMFDANPRTAARRRPGVNGWFYNEPDFETSVLGGGGPDTWHELNAIFEGGTSYVFVIDASGSMGDNNRMVQVKRSARSFIANMSARDEVAVITFYDCTDIQVLQGFTREHQAVIAAIDGIEPRRDTPLAAAILRGGDFLLERSHYEERSLIVLTDGEESCDGDPVAAAALFRDRVALQMGLGATNTPAQPAPEPEPDTEPDEDDPEPSVEARPDDREAWSVTQSGGSTLPTISLIRTRFHEWEVGENCAAQVTRETFHTYYGQAGRPNGSPTQSFGVNSRASRSDTLDFALCSNGQAGMDAIRSQWQNLAGTDFATARADAEARAMRALNQ